jgi:2-polyprenyl-6-methoxyphenol hydroxylase-like FAD-dependent oxidoreductase
VRIACVGGGPAGLYFSMLMKLWDPANDVKVFERNKEGVTHGWGVTMGRTFLATLAGLDAESAQEIERSAVRWQDQVISFRGRRDVNRSNGDAYGVSRQRFVDVLAARATRLGVDIRYEHEVRDRSELPGADLIVAADGAGSQLRGAPGQAGFGTAVRQGRNKYIWLGTSKLFDTFHFFFEETPAGWIWAYAYPHEPAASTFVVECAPETWAALGLDADASGAVLDCLEDIFAPHLDGHRLTAQFPDGTDAHWLSFRTVSNKRWYDGNVVLAGDSAHTAHFSVGAGTTLAINDVIALAAQLRLACGPVPGGTIAPGGLATALQAYAEQRQAELRLQATEAKRSAAWFESVSRYTALPPRDFATVVHSRRAPLLPKLPPRVFCQLCHARERFGVVDALRSLAGR